jgi:hypothetical protein
MATISLVRPQAIPSPTPKTNFNFKVETKETKFRKPKLTKIKK